MASAARQFANCLASVQALGPWTTDPRAAALLASCAKFPPERTAFQIAPAERWTRDEWNTRYVGRRVDRLRKIYSELACAALHEGDRTGDYAAFNAFDAQPSVDEAIEAAVTIPVLAPVLEVATWADAA